MRYVNEIVALDDMRFAIRLKRPCPQLLFGLGARQCFMMPERVASRPGTEQLTDPTGSGPFRFLKDEWVSGARCAYARFEGYRPRQEPPAFFAGGKVANFERVEWIVQPDPATAAAALQKNEVDWVELPLIDLCPMLKKSPGVDVAVVDPGGWLMFMAINHLNPPFDNLKVRQAHSARPRSAGLRGCRSWRPEGTCHRAYRPVRADHADGQHRRTGAPDQPA